MPTLFGHVSSLPPHTAPPQHQQSATDKAVVATPGQRSIHEELDRPTPAICPTDDEAIMPKRHRGDVDTEAPKAARGLRSDNKRSLDYVMRSGLAGGLAGCAAKTVVGPLDRVKILFQTSNPQFNNYASHPFGVVRAVGAIYQQEGMRGLFRGHSVTLLRVFPYAAVKFLAYEQFRAVLIPDKLHETPWRRLVSGSMAGITSVFCTYPLEVIRVRLAFETKSQYHSSIATICRKIYHEHPLPAAAPSLAASSTSSLTSTGAALSTAATHAVRAVSPRAGLVNFYRGFSSTIFGMLPYAGMSFLTHDTAGDWLRHPRIAKYTTLPSPPDTYRPQLTVWAQLLSGGFAGMVGQTASYPFEVIRRRMQVGGAVGDRRRLSVAETVGRIWAERGLRGFWVGLGIGYVKVIPMTATSFFVYGRAKMWLDI